MKERIELWKRVFESDDNSITKQLSSLTWDLAIFTCLADAIRHQHEIEGKKLNDALLGLVANGFWNKAFLGIRKLADKNGISGKKGVCSIGGLLADAKAARKKITRRVFVEDIAGFNYDYEATRARHHEFMRTHPPGAIYGMRPFDEEWSIMRHVEFDRFSGTTADNRNPDDLIRPEVFTSLEDRMARLEVIVDHTHVEVAHAATEASKKGRRLESWRLEDAKIAFKDLAQTADILGTILCYNGIGSVLPHPQFDQFEHLEQPFFTGDPMMLHEKWQEIADEITRWHDTTDVVL